jgi:hypothetical protein
VSRGHIRHIFGLHDQQERLMVSLGAKRSPADDETDVLIAEAAIGINRGEITVLVCQMDRNKQQGTNTAD